MTAKEYLAEQLSDPCPEATSVQTRTALAAYAIRMHKEVDGYSISELEQLLNDCNIGEATFIKCCADFVSNCVNFIAYQHRIPVLDD
jgi:hypothetical protein